jgi:hypothetical protein
MTNEELWERIRSLTGHRVHVSHPPTSLTVVHVTDTSMVLRGARGRQTVPRATIEAVYALGRNSNALEPAQLRSANLEGYDATCLVGILNAIGADRE